MIAIFILYLHYKKILKLVRAYAARAGRGEEGKKKRKMNIILYYIILYIILYIYVFINILPLRANARGVFADRFFFFDCQCWGGFAFLRLPHLPQPFASPLFFAIFANNVKNITKINNLTKFFIAKWEWLLFALKKTLINSSI